MSFVPLAILPSALLAWPIYYYGMGADAENAMVVEDAIEHCLSLVLTIASFIALNRIARRCVERDRLHCTSIVYLLANRSTMEKVWLLLQPLLLLELQYKQPLPLQELLGLPVVEVVEAAEAAAEEQLEKWMELEEELLVEKLGR